MTSHVIWTSPRTARLGGARRGGAASRKGGGVTMAWGTVSACPGPVLVQLAGDPAAAQHRQSARQLIRPEDGLVGQVICLRQTRHRGDRGAGPGSDYETPRPQHAPPGAGVTR